MRKALWTVVLPIIVSINLNAQDPHRFDDQIEKFSDLSVPQTEELTVFTGSSSIRFWKNLDKDCNAIETINTGFGGSHMSDLLYFLEQTVLRFNPDEVYIYEGDNDIAAGKEANAILETARQITKKILASNPETKIHFISAKPSPSRWELKDQYKAFNALLKDYCDSHEQIFYVDVWGIMLDDTGRPKPDIFVSDSLHMNLKGYLLWKDMICNESEGK